MTKYHSSDVWRLGDSVTPTEKLVLLALIDYGARIHPSQGTLALKTGLSVRTVGDTVASLRRKGLVTTVQRGAKSLSYSVVLKQPSSANSAEHDRQPLPRRSANSAEEVGNHCRGILTSQGTSQPNHGAATAAAGVAASPWEGIPEDAIRRIRRWVPAGADELCAAQRRVTERRLLELGVARDQLGRWWSRLGDRWGDTGVPPYDNLATTLDGIGGEVRDRLAVLAFRIGVGRVAA